MTVDAPFRTMAELEAGLPHIQDSPKDSGRLEMIVSRPQKNERTVLAEGLLCPEEGLRGDTWLVRGSSHTWDRSANPDEQLTVMNARLIALVARDRSRWPLAGDQLYVDLDLSEPNLPAGTRLALGSAVIEVTAEPHLPCMKFRQRYGGDALTFLNSPLGRGLRLRGLHARVVTPGAVRQGDLVRKVG
jgi:hypothetical protein